jgi:hypothetical protein
MAIVVFKERVLNSVIKGTFKTISVISDLSEIDFQTVLTPLVPILMSNFLEFYYNLTFFDKDKLTQILAHSIY